MGFNNIERVREVDRALEVHFRDGKSTKFEDCWLRDHCRCSSCYHAESTQRAIHLLDIPDVTIQEVTHDKSLLYITWSDNHESTYSYEFLSQFHYKQWRENRKIRPVIWSGNIQDKVGKIHVDEFLNSLKGKKRVFKSILDYGVAFIEGVSESLEATEVVSKALGGIQHTMYGGMWLIYPDSGQADPAFSNQPIDVHNDHTYFNEAGGLQIFHCIEHKNGSGGESTLVDGFYGAQQLKKEYPQDFEFLSNFNLEAELIIEEGHHYSYSAPVITVNEDTEELDQIRFNIYDRAPMAFANSEECRTYYRSLRNLAKYYQNEDNQWKFKLHPGTVMVIDNFRLLHGRTGFTGKRIIVGSNVSRSDWMDRARVLNLIQ